MRRRRPCAPAKSSSAAIRPASPKPRSTKSLAKCPRRKSGKPTVELLVHGGLCQSKGQARKDIEGGGAYLNNNREASVQRSVTAKDLLFGKHLLLRKGKRNYVVLTAK